MFTMPISFTLLDVTLAVAGIAIFTHYLIPRSSLPLPPGPKKLPLLGNLLDMPKEKEWLTFAEWGNKWGDIVSVSIFGQQLIILNSIAHVTEMLDKRGAIYSDRPSIPMGGELVGWKDCLALLPYGPRFRNTRKHFYQLIGSHSSMSQFLPVEEAETHRFLQRLLSTPEDLEAHIRKTAGAIILRISHGYQVKENKDPFVTLAEAATDQFSLGTAPGVFLVNLVPALRHLPSWFPGAGFKKTAKAWAAILFEMVEQPHTFVKQQMASGTAEVSFTSKLLDDANLSEEQEFEIKWSAASVYSGGADTTVAAIHSFFKAMALYPEVQARAQAEIDAVVGTNRLPCFSDKDDLPYINALALEVLRWHTVAPTGVPHRVMEDDVYNGFSIPKGSLIITNIWAMSHDPQVYSNPMSFDPARFIASGDHKPEQDPRNVCFGFGRRICPGKVLADASIFISCAMTLAAFDISKYVEGGVAQELYMEQTTGTISHTTPFKCSIKPRSPKAVELISAGI